MNVGRQLIEKNSQPQVQRILSKKYLFPFRNPAFIHHKLTECYNIT